MAKHYSKLVRRIMDITKGDHGCRGFAECGVCVDHAVKISEVILYMRTWELCESPVTDDQRPRNPSGG